MFSSYKPVIFFFLFFISLSVFGQDSIYHWNISSKKIGDGKFELSFSTQGANGWELYSPNQTIPDLVTTELKFGDSAISLQKGFTESGGAKEITSIPFNAKAKVYEGATEWKAVINIAGTVPAQLQGNFSYFYGHDSSFLNGTFNFNVALEGGVASSMRIKIPTSGI